MVGVRAKDHDDKRQIILEQAAELFAKQGFHKTSIAEIARACNVTSKAWIYHYFPNKETVLFTLVRDFLVYVTERVGAAIATHADGRSQLRAFVHECLEIYEDYRINYPSLFTEIGSLEESLQKQIRAVERDYADLLMGVLKKINPAIDSRKHQARAMTMIAFGAINWTYTWFDAKGPLRLDEIADLISQMLIRGMQTDEQASDQRSDRLSAVGQGGR